MLGPVLLQPTAFYAVLYQYNSTSFYMVCGMAVVILTELLFISQMAPMIYRWNVLLQAYYEMQYIAPTKGSDAE